MRLDRSRLIAILVAGWLLPGQAYAFKDGQHKESSRVAATNAGSIAPDIAKFSQRIIKWSFGIGSIDFGAAPAEQLAHSRDQRTAMSDVRNNNGDFRDFFFSQANLRYMDGDFSSESAGTEGAYVLLGSCLHLIEDQASFPHGANILHGQNWWQAITDNWETFDESVGFTGTSGAQTAPIDSYHASLFATQAKIPGLVDPVEVEFNSQGQLVPRRYWLFNDELRQRGDTAKSATRYAGEYNHAAGGVDPPFLGDYGGASGADIYSHDENGGLNGLYRQQGTQAADFSFNFLLRFSKGLPPISSNLTILGPSSSGQPIIDSQNGSPVKFKVTENRTQNVDVRVFVQETGQAVVAESAVRRLEAAKSAAGTLQETTIPGPMTWNNLRTSLDQTKDSDLSLLPFESEFELVWKGKVDGAPLADGQFNLCVVSRDLDVLSSPGPAEGRSDTCVSFMIDRSSPVAQITVTPGPDLDDNQPPDVSVAIAGEFPSSPIALSTPPALDISAFAVSAQDSGSGIVSAHVKEDGSVIFTQSFNPPSQAPQLIPKRALKNGSLYELSVLDAVGNLTIARFYAAFKPPDLKAIQVTPLRQPDDSALHTVQFTAGDAVWLRDARLIEKGRLEALIPGFGSDSWGNHWDQIVANSLPRTGPPQAIAWLSPGTTSQRYLYEDVPNGDYVAFAVGASSIIGRQAAFAFKNVTHDVVIYDGSRLGADCVHLELKVEPPRVVDETNLFAGTIHLRQAAPGMGFIRSGLLTVPVGGRSNAGATVSTRFNRIRVGAGPIHTTQVPGGDIIVTGLGAEQFFDMIQSTVTLPDGSAVAFEANAASPQNVLFADGGQPVADTWRSVKNGDLLSGARARLRTTLTATSDAMGAPYLTQVIANVTDHEVIVTQTGTPDPAMGRFPIPAGTNVTVSGISPRGNTATVTVPYVSAPGELALVDVPLNADSQCPVTSGLPTPDLLLDVGVLSNGSQTFDLEMALGTNACQAGSGAALIHEGTAGTENITGEVTTSCGIKGTATSASPFYVNVPTGADRLPPVTGWEATAVRDGQGLVVISSPAVLPLVAVDAGSEVQLTEVYVDSGPFAIAGGMVALPEGFHDAYYRSRDSSANLEATRRSRIRVDSTPPLISALSPSSGAFGAAVSSFTVSWLLADALDPAPTAQARLLQLEDTGTPNPGSTAVVVALGQLFFAPELDDGFWVLEVTAKDFVLNSTVAYSVPFEIVHPLDSRPPRTQLTLGPPSVPGPPAYVSSSTLIWLEAVDDLTEAGDGLGVGVASRSYSIDPSTVFVQSPATFSLTAPGIFTIRTFSVDLAGHAEDVQVSSVVVDLFPPVLDSVVPASGTYIGQPPHILSAAFTDPEVLAGLPGSGVDPASLSVFVDGELRALGSSFSGSLAEGPHIAGFTAADRVGHAAMPAVSSFTVDLTSPSIAVLSTGPYYTQPRPVLAASFSDMLSGLATGQLSLSLGGPALALTTFLQGGDGKVASWGTAPSLSFPVVNHAMASLGGFLYSLGGHKNVNLGGDEVRTEVYVSALGPGGVPGPWTETMALPARLAGHSAVAVNGRVYVLGGARTGTPAVNTVYYASPSGVAGALGVWTTAAALPQAISGLDAVGVGVGSIGPYLYALGGQDAGGQPHREVYVAPLDPVGGAPGGWTATTLLPEPLGSPRVVEWNQRLYVMGGITAPALSNASKKVWSAPVLAGGLLGAWRPEPDLPRGLYGAEAVSALGRVYSLGGWDASAVAHAEVNSAAVGEDGVLGPWRAEAPLHLPLVALAAAATPEGIYYSGGMTTGNVAVADARFARFEAGTPGSARLEGVPVEDLPDGQYNLAASGADRVGNTGSASALITVDRTPPLLALSAAGTALSSSAAAFVPGALPELVAAFSDAVSGVDPAGLALALDGSDVTSLAAVSAAEVRFTPASPLSSGRHSLSASGRDRAGNQAALSADFILDPEPPAVALSSPAPGAFYASSSVVIAAAFSDGLSGLATDQIRLSWEGGALEATLAFTEVSDASGWQSAPSLAFPVVNHAMASLGGFLYSLGGHKNVNLGGDEVRTEVFVSALGPGGVPGPWNATMALPARLAGHSAVAVNGRVYVLGGARTGTPAVNTVYYASPSGVAGALGVWTTAAALPQAISGLDAVGVGVGSIGPYLYALGGQDAGGQPHREVYVAPLDPGNGAPGGWTATTLLPEPLGSPRVVEWNQRLYVMGGITAPALSNASKKVWSAPVLAGGLLGAWRPEPDLPRGLYGAEAVSALGRVYSLGGWDASAVAHAEVNSAAVGTGGVLGPWRAEAPLHLPLVALAAAATPEGIYYSGGMTTGNVAVADARWRSLQTGVAAASASALAAGLPEGAHVAQAEAADRAGNTALSSAAFFVDLTAPDTQLYVAAASRTVDGALFVLGVPTVSFSPTDGPAGAASGVAQTLFAVDAGTEAAAGEFVTLPPGWSTVHFRSIDAVGNAEVLKSSSVKLDRVAPAAVVDLAGTALSTQAVRLSWTVPGDDGDLGDIADGAAAVSFSQDGAVVSSGPLTLVFPPGPLPAGGALAWTASGLASNTLYHAAVYTRDTAGNWSAASDVVAVRTLPEDALPPRTSLVVEGPQIQGGRLFITPQTELSLSATDDLLLAGDALGVGVAGSSYSIDSAELFTGYADPFSIIQESAHDLRYFSTDRAGHVEGVKLASVAVDGTGPAVALGFSAPFRVFLGTTTVFVQGLGPLFVSATDCPDLAVGTSVVYRSVDGGPAVASPGAFNLLEGLRELSFWANDALGNQGSTVTASLKLDATPPAAVGDLLVAALSSADVRVSWTSPGDDGLGGDIFDAAVRLDFGTDAGNLTQRVLLSSGTLRVGAAFAESFSGLAAGTSYYARAYTRDSAGNWSAPSASASARTFTVALSQDGLATVTAPTPIEITVVSTLAESQAYAVAIATQALIPSGTVFYELTGGLSFAATAPAVISFTFGPALVDPLSVFIYTYDTTAMAWSSASIVNQTLTQLSPDEYRISGEIFHTSLYAPMVRDTLPPLTAFSVAGSSAVLEGRLFAVGGSSGVLTAQDQAPRGGVASGLEATLYRGGTGPETAYNAPFGLHEGALEILFHSIDKSANSETEKRVPVFVDASAPSVAFSADQSTFPVPGGFGTLSATVTVTLSALDPEVNGASSGLASFAAVLDGNPIPVSAGVLLGAGLHTLNLSAADRLGNASSLTLKVAVGDTLPPVTTLSVGLPKASLPDGSILVSGAGVLTLGAEDFAESGAPAGVAQTRYRFGAEPYSVYADAFSVPGPDGDKVLGFYSTDRAGNVEDPPKTQALVRDATPPGLAFTFPRPDEAGLCRLVQGPVQVRGTVSDAHLAAWSLKEGTDLIGSGAQNRDGLLGIWDASARTGAFTLSLSASDLVENSAEALLTLHAGSPSRTLALGGKKALDKPRGVAWAPNRIYVADTNQDLVRVYDGAGNLLTSFGDKRRSLKLNRPAGLAVDVSGNVFVADANNKRVVKLSAAGILLQEFGGKRILEKPVAVALTGGNILVADAHAGEVVVFSEAGTFLRRVALPSVAGDHDDHDDDEEEARPMALAAEDSGAFWVADAKGGRVMRYDAAFNLVQSIPGFERPEGLAVSPSGACLAVVDSKAERVRTFDAARGTELAAFGKDSLHKPAQAVFTADGQLLVANRNDDQVTGFGLPGTPIIIAMTQPKGGFRASAATETPSEPVVARVGQVEGGFVEEPGGASVEVPAGAVAQDLDISVAVAAEAGVAERAAQNLSPASSPREFGPHGQSFTVPVTITLPYDPNLVAGARPDELKIHYWNAERSSWEALVSRVDADAQTVSAQTSHFSLYQVLVPVRTLSMMADPEATFALRSVYAFPNPAVGGQKPTIHVAVGKADRVTIRIYDIAGTPVHETTLDGSPSVVNDDTGAHFAYEYSWAGHIPSGVYLYTITAEKAGNAPIKRVGKLAVVR